METKGKILIGFGIAIIVFLIGFGIFSATPAGRAMWNNYDNAMNEVDEATKYENKKKVEDTCRAMISSYKSDKLRYETLKDSDSALERSEATQARNRANQTANTYNEYILKNKHVWAENVPADIYMELELIY